MNKRTKQTTVRLDKTTSQQIGFISRGLGKSKLQLLKELFNRLVEGCFMLTPERREDFPSSLNMSIEVDDNTVKITFDSAYRSSVVGAFESPIGENDAKNSAKVMEKSKDALSHKLEKAFESDK